MAAARLLAENRSRQAADGTRSSHPSRTTLRSSAGPSIKGKAMSRYVRLIVAAAILIGSAGCGRAPQGFESRAAEPEAVSPPPKIEKVREPAVAGRFYPGDAEELADQIDGYLAKVKPTSIEGLRGLVSPHAGYVYSGQTAAYAYRRLSGLPVKTVVVLAPSHHVWFEGASIPDVDAYATPLGLVRLSPRAAELAKRRPFVRSEVVGSSSPHAREHALEVQLPFLQRTLKDFSVVPMVLGQVSPEEVARALEGVIDAGTIVVASSDLSHQHAYDEAVALDTSCVEAICDLDVRRMEKEEACGKLPVLTLMHLARKKGWKARLLDYRNSGDVTGDKSGVVGYAAIAFYEPESAKRSAETPVSTLAPHERKVLLELAGKTVEEVVRHNRLPRIDPAELPESLKELRACFVTLTKEGELRGCIGSILPQEPLCRAVIERARSAAVDDPRFPPVAPAELDDLEIEVSVLSVPRRLEYDSPEELLGKLRPGVDGVVLVVGGRRATYLPQVWEKLPEPEVFLSRLSQKAGLPPSAWQSPEATIQVYQVEAFKQSEM